jgi:flagellar basal-body rod modification protein FlgD
MSIAAAASTAASATSSSSSQNSLAALSSNFQDFLGMLMTQLKNQDPTSPMDTNQFTSELVQFSGVEQQINTNGSLTQLISLTQSGQMLQGSSMVGKTVQFTSGQMPLQNASGSVSFTATAPGTAQVTISNSAGGTLLHSVVSTTAGNNTFTWNGKDSQGNQQPDGAYSVAVSSGATGSGAALPFTVSGTVTGVVNNGGTLDLQLGAETAAFSTVQSVSG